MDSTHLSSTSNHLIALKEYEMKFELSKKTPKHLFPVPTAAATSAPPEIQPTKQVESAEPPDPPSEVTAAPDDMLQNSSGAILREGRMIRVSSNSRLCLQGFAMYLATSIATGSDCLGSEHPKQKVAIVLCTDNPDDLGCYAEDFIEANNIDLNGCNLRFYGAQQFVVTEPYPDPIDVLKAAENILADRDVIIFDFLWEYENMVPNVDHLDWSYCAFGLDILKYLAKCGHLVICTAKGLALDEEDSRIYDTALNLYVTQSSWNGVFGGCLGVYRKINNLKQENGNQFALASQIDADGKVRYAYRRGNLFKFGKPKAKPVTKTKRKSRRNHK